MRARARRPDRATPASAPPRRAPRDAGAAAGIDPVGDRQQPVGEPSRRVAGHPRDGQRPVGGGGDPAGRLVARRAERKAAAAVAEAGIAGAAPPAGPAPPPPLARALWLRP